MTTLGPVCSDIIFSGIPVIAQVGNPMPEIIALPWQCAYCGRTHPASCDHCWDGANGCGASRPAEYNELPRGILHLPELSEYKAGVTIEAIITARELGMSYEDFQYKIGKAFLPALQKIVRGMLALC